MKLASRVGVIARFTSLSAKGKDEHLSLILRTAAALVGIDVDVATMA